MPLLILRRTLLVGSALAILAGCDSTGAPDGLFLNISTTQVAPGDEVIVVLDNNSNRSTTYSPCPALGRGEGEAFEPVEPNAVCALILVGVEAGRTVAFRVQVPADVAEGTYSVRVGVGRETPDRFVSSPAFRVVAPL